MELKTNEITLFGDISICEWLHKVLTNDKAGSGGKAKWFYIKKIDLDRQQPEKIKL